MRTTNAWFTPLRRHRTDLLWGLLIFAAAFALRVAFVFWINPDPETGMYDDSTFYHTAATAIADGEGYSHPLWRAPTAQWPPGYPALLASVYVLPGSDLIAGKVLNSLLGAAACTLVFAMGRLLWSRGIGVAAGFILAFFPNHVFASTLIMSEVAYATLLTGVVSLFAFALTRARAVGFRVHLLLGLALGAATLVRGEGGLLPLVFGLVWWLWTRSVKRAALSTALVFVGLALVLGGWTIRNVIQVGAPVPVSTGVGGVMAIAHWEGADGGTNLLRVFQPPPPEYRELPYPEKEVKTYQWRMRDALGYMLTHPRHEISLIPRRLQEMYWGDQFAVDWIAHKVIEVDSDTLSRLRIVSNAYYFAAIGLGIVGLWQWWRTRREFAFLLGGVIVYMSAMFGVLSYGAQRFHMSLIPVVTLLAAPAALALIRPLWNRTITVERVGPARLIGTGWRVRRAVLVGVTAAAVAGAILFVGGWSTSGGLADSVSVDWKDRSRTYNDLTLVAPHGGTQILWVAMDGQVVKKLHTPWTVSLAEQLPTGNILMLAGGAVRELDGDGKIVWQYKPRQGIAHHEVLRTPRGTTFTLIMDHDRTLDLWYDIIVEVDRKGSVVWEWNSLDHLDTRIDREPLDPPHKFLGVTDWLHANSIGLFPNGDILLSLRNLNRLLRIDYPSGEIIWSWGEGILGHQHSAQVLENGNILLFDNGFHQTTDRPCAKQPCASRALEVDPRTGTIIWSYERQGYFSFAFGDADRLPNGNTLVTFGQQKPEAVVIEVTPQGDVVWTLTSKIRTLVPPVTGDKEVATLYRAQRVEQVPKSVR